MGTILAPKSAAQSASGADGFLNRGRCGPRGRPRGAHPQSRHLKTAQRPNKLRPDCIRIGKRPIAICKNKHIPAAVQCARNYRTFPTAIADPNGKESRPNINHERCGRPRLKERGATLIFCRKHFCHKRHMVPMKTHKTSDGQQRHYLPAARLAAHC